MQEGPGTNVLLIASGCLFATGYSRQYSLSFNPTNGLPAGASTVVANDDQVTIPLTNSESFFRRRGQYTRGGSRSRRRLT